MWDTFRLSAVGNFSVRRIALTILAGFASALLMAILHNVPSAFADTASWDGDSITYNNETYTKVTNPPSVIPGILSNNTAIYQTPKGADGKVKVIAVDPSKEKSADISDAQLGTFTIDNNGNYIGATSSSPDPPLSNITISAAPGSVNTANQNNSNGQEKTSCGVVSIGWIVCGISQFLAGAMDKAYDWINDFLVIKPLTTDTSSGLFQAWDIARGIANACFILAFLVIIYSQITSVGISNYEIKKMIPRLIIAAVLVNVSYYICAGAVDISNIFGDSIQHAMTEIRDSLPSPKAQTSWGSWGTMTTFILSAGTIGAIGIGASGGVLALVPLLVPLLIGGVFSLLVALMVLAARQALITVLVVLAPIAFVAYLLPNTEKQFNRWRDLFVNMLMIFPLFSLLFGGAQLASFIIIQNTDQISVVLLAMFVQVAPLAVTPFLLKISHNLISQLAGLANNPKKGLVDRSRNWSKERSDMYRERHNARGAKKPWYTSSGLSYRRARGKLHRENNVKLSQTRVAAAVANEKRAKKVMADIKEAELEKNAGEAMAEAIFEDNKLKSPTMQRHSGNLRLAKLQAETRQHIDDARWEEVLSKRGAQNPNAQYIAYAAQAQAAMHDHHVADGQKEAAQVVQRQEHVEALKTDLNLQREIGGIDPHGATKAYARAKATDVEEKAKLVKQIEDSSPIMPGRTSQMQIGLRDAVAAGNAEEARAYVNMLAKSNDPGVNTLRETLVELEGQMRANGILDDVKFHIDNHASLNNEAEDIVKWSRMENVPLDAVGSSARTWENQTANKILGQKQSTQMIAIQSGGVSESTMREILTNPAKVGVKPEVLREIRRRLRIDMEGGDDDKLRDNAFWNSRNSS